MYDTDLSYRQWQKRNTDGFQRLSKAQQKKARQLGYHNVGWQRIKSSWDVLQQVAPPTFFDAKLRRGDLIGAVTQSIMEAEQAKKDANEGLRKLRRGNKKLKAIAEKILSK